MSGVEPSVRYLGRLMEVLIKHDHITVTNLAMESRMNHQRCGKMLAMLEKAGYVQTGIMNRRKYFQLTDRGKESAQRLVDANHTFSNLVADVNVQNVRT